MLTPSFHFKILEDFFPIMNENVEIFVRNLEKQMTFNSNGIIDDISVPILACALDIICGE